MYLKVLTTKSYVVNIYAVCTYYACNNNFAKFLLMQEFYIGELDEDDLEKLQKNGAAASSPSAAFLEQLDRVTTWRLKKCDLKIFETYKSF